MFSLQLALVGFGAPSHNGVIAISTIDLLAESLWEL